VFVRLEGADEDAQYSIVFDVGASETQVATGRMVELRATVCGSRFRVSVQRNGLAPVTLPHDGWIDIG
jgi:hypothetical protein